MARVVVVGSINQDVVARAPHIPRAGETVTGSDLQHYAGGKGLNQAIAAARSDVATEILGCVGRDAAAASLLHTLETSGVDIHHVRHGDHPTGTAIIEVSADGENSIVIVPGANDLLTSSDVDDVNLMAGDVVLCQLEVPPDVVVRACQRARTVGAVAIVNPSPAPHKLPEAIATADVLIVNEVELSQLSRMPIVGDEPEPTVEAAATALRRSAEQVI